MATLQRIEFTAREFNSDGEFSDDSPHYTFDGFRLPTGEVVIPAASTNDSWFASDDAVQANGCAEIVARADLDETEEWSHEQIAQSVRGSASEFGRDAIPESLRYLLDGAE